MDIVGDAIDIDIELNIDLRLPLPLENLRRIGTLDR